MPEFHTLSAELIDLWVSGRREEAVSKLSTVQIPMAAAALAADVYWGLLCGHGSIRATHWAQALVNRMHTSAPVADISGAPV